MRRLVVALLVASCGSEGPPSPEIPDAGYADAALPLHVMWTSLGFDGPDGRVGSHVGTLDGKVVLFGGYGPFDTLRNDTWIWDGSWREVVPSVSPPGRADGALAEGDGRVFLIGGVERNSAGLLETVGDTWSFDGVTWTHVADATIMPLRYLAGAQHRSPIGPVAVIAGGERPPNWDTTNDSWAFDPGTSKWVWLGLRFGLRAGATTTLHERAHLVGGVVDNDGVRTLSTTVYHLLNGTSGLRWAPIGELARGRADHAAATVADRVVVFGGWRNLIPALAETDAWPGGVVVVGNEPPATASPRMASIPDGALLYEESGETWRLTVAQ